MTKEIELLNSDSKGLYRVETAHSTFYILDMDRRRAIRNPAEGRGALWKDNEWWVFIDLKCKINFSMYFAIPKGEGEYTWRTSTPVASIKKLSKSEVNSLVIEPKGEETK